MTKRESKLKSKQIKALMSEDEDFLRPLMKAALQEVLEAEMSEALGADKGERTREGLGYRSGYYSRRLVTRVGTLELRVAQDREGRFSTEVFERYQRSEKALVGALIEMYVQGISTRKVKAIREELCRHEFSASTVSELNKKLDGEVERFAGRRLEESIPTWCWTGVTRRWVKRGWCKTARCWWQSGSTDRRGGAGDWGGASQSRECDQLEGVFVRVKAAWAAWGAPGGERPTRRLKAGRGRNAN